MIINLIKFNWRLREYSVVFRVQINASTVEILICFSKKAYIPEILIRVEIIMDY